MARNRVREEIKLKSPISKQEFTAKWSGGTRSFNKRLAMYEYADVNGTVVDDFGVGGDRYPITLIFDGPTYEGRADQFIKACRENGKWEVIHPTKGFLGLQLISLSEQDQPVTQANLIKIDTEWLEFIDPRTHKTGAQLRAQTNADIGLLNVDQRNRFNRVKMKTFSDRSKLSDMADAMAKGVDKVLGPIAAKNAEINQKMLRAQRDIQSMISSGVIEPLKLAGQIQETIQTPMYAIRDIKGRLRACKDLALNIFAQNDAFNPGDNDSANFNRALMQELSLTSVLASVTTVGITSDLNSREDAITLIEAQEGFKSDIAAHLGDSQQGLADALIDTQYIMQEASYNQMINMTGSGKAFLIKEAMDLKVAKRYTLTKDRATLEVAISMYGDDWSEDQFTFFVESNNLRGDELLMLPAGKELVIYV